VKLVRIGESGAETPALHSPDTVAHDLSAIVDDIKRGDARERAFASIK